MVVTFALSHQRDRPYVSALKDALNPGPREAEQRSANDQQPIGCEDEPSLGSSRLVFGP